ncbi:hypothetical protein J6590_013117 [Homalodisca vitripennis]|nr:hypothetical protein J6590_013117 [Homalodisca vitripennis]
MECAWYGNLERTPVTFSVTAHRCVICRPALRQACRRPRLSPRNPSERSATRVWEAERTEIIEHGYTVILCGRLSLSLSDSPTQPTVWEAERTETIEHGYTVISWNIFTRLSPRNPSERSATRVWEAERTETIEHGYTVILCGRLSLSLSDSPDSAHVTRAKEAQRECGKLSAQKLLSMDILSRNPSQISATRVWEAERTETIEHGYTVILCGRLSLSLSDSPDSAHLSGPNYWNADKTSNLVVVLCSIALTLAPVILVTIVRNEVFSNSYSHLTFHPTETTTTPRPQDEGVGVFLYASVKGGILKSDRVSAAACSKVVLPLRHYLSQRYINGRNLRFVSKHLSASTYCNNRSVAVVVKNESFV